MEDKFNISFYLDGKECSPPSNWEDIKIPSTLVSGESFNQLEVDEFSFVNENAQYIINFVEENSPFQGIGFVMKLKAETIGEVELGCVLDCTTLQIENEVEVKIKIKPDEGLDLLSTRSEAITYGVLADLDNGEPGFIDKEHYTDVPVIIRKKFDGVEVAFSSLVIFLMAQQVMEYAEKTKEKIINSVKVLTSDPLQKPAEALAALAYILLTLAYFAFTVVAVLKLINTVFDNLVGKPTKYKGITLRTALERGLDYFNISLDCDIPEIDYYVYLPSKTDNKIRKNRRDEGVPNPSDFGYSVAEMINLIDMLFHIERYLITNAVGQKTLVIRAKKSDDVRKKSDYIMPNRLHTSVLTEKYKLNAEDMKANFMLTFSYDPSDEYTMPNARDTPFDSKKKDEEKNRYERGVSYEVITDLPSPIKREFKLNKGLEQIRIPMALGTRRNNLSVFEQSAKVMLSGVDLVIKLFGGKTFNEKLDEGRGRLIISHNSFNIPKLICLQGGLIPQNHRDLLSARALYNNYHYWRSFVSNPNFAQREVYTGITIPFSFADYFKTRRYSAFSTQEGAEGVFKKIVWNISADTAECDYEVYRKYIKDGVLEEKFIET